MSAVSVRLQNKGHSPKHLAKMKKAFAAAAIQSADWDDEAQDNVVEIMDRLVEPGGYEKNKKRVNRIMENCNLPLI